MGFADFLKGLGQTVMLPVTAGVTATSLAVAAGTAALEGGKGPKTQNMLDFADATMQNVPGGLAWADASVKFGQTEK